MSLTSALLPAQALGIEVAAAAGGPVPAAPDEAPLQAELADGQVLVLADSKLSSQDERLLRAFVTELQLAQERMQLRRISPRPPR